MVLFPVTLDLDFKVMGH